MAPADRGSVRRLRLRAALLSATVPSRRTMNAIDRRGFLGTSVSSLAAALAAGPALLGQGPSSAGGATFKPDTLFLTWQRDPTTTMTVQWVGREAETDNTNVYCSRLKDGVWT